jgi:hypothetical protein
MKLITLPLELMARAKGISITEKTMPDTKSQDRYMM